MSGNEASKLRLLGLTGIYQDAGFFLNETESVIGRRPECDVVLNEKTISGKHARIFNEGGKYMVEDLNSTNGTYVNGARIRRAPVEANDIIKFHKIEFRFITDGGTVLTEAAPIDVSPEEPVEVMAPPPSSPTPAPQYTPPTPVPEVPQPRMEPAYQTPPPVQGQPQPAVQVNVHASPQVQTPQPQQPPVAATSRGIGALLGGTVFALLFNIIVPFIVMLTQVPGGARNAIDRLIQGYLAIFPLLHTHVGGRLAFRGGAAGWIMAICVVAGLIIGGYLSQKSRRGKPVGNAFSLALIYTGVALVLQLLAIEFRMQIWLNSFRVLEVGGREAELNLVLGVLYILAVVFVLALIGSSIAKSKQK